MARYVDGFVIPVSKKKLAAYRRIAQKAGKIWREHGALAYVETVGDDLKPRWGFPKMAKSRSGETIVFSWIVYKSKADRNRVNAKVMNDPRMQPMMDPKAMPFDMKRMAMGGFEVIVEA
jgi:uncharacterized protein YbaA (DUF1428 family)